jgi:vacuolar-type H+-ATPase subunit I/STV1
MSVRTIFLARALGLYCIILATAIFLRRDTFAATANALIADAPLVLVVGVFTVFVGVAMVLLHNLWSGGVLPVIITLVGWATLIKGVLLLAFPPASVGALYSVPSHYVLIICTLSLALGVYFVIEGFRTSLDERN